MEGNLAEAHVSIFEALEKKYLDQICVYINIYWHSFN